MITVIDAPTGSGKTSWAIQEINNHLEQSYIYVTPFLKQIDRINDSKHGCNHRFKEPTFEYGQKIDDFNRLIADGNDVAVTHSTFLNATDMTMQLLQDGNYICIIDEALDVIRDFNDISETSQNPRQKVYDTDIVDTLEKYNMIHIDDETRKVTWIGDIITNPENKHYVVYKYAELNRLYCVDRKFLITIFPPEIFNCFKEVYVMTYIIESSLFYYYMKKFDMEFALKSITKTDIYNLVDYNIRYDLQHRQRSKELITICDNKRMNSFKYSAFSATWYKDKSARHKDIIMLKNNMQNYFKRIMQCKSKDVMWTTYKDFEDKMAVNSYKIATTVPKKHAGRPRTIDDTKYKARKDEEAQGKYKCFVPCNAKATNDFQDRSVLAYMINFNINPEIAKFFLPYKVNKDIISLGSLLQWIWRSRIRQEIPQPINLYLPSPRMRKLLNDWLDGVDIPDWKKSL
jgi:hypothetical protein